MMCAAARFRSPITAYRARCWRPPSSSTSRNRRFWAWANCRSGRLSSTTRSKFARWPMSRSPSITASSTPSRPMRGCPALSKLWKTGLAKLDRHRGKAAETRPPAARRLSRHRIIRKAFQERAECDAGFHPRQIHARALMNSGGKGQMPIRVAQDVETFRVFECCRIAVGGADAQRDERALAKRFAANLDVPRRHPVAKLVRAFITQHLFDCGAQQFRLCRQFRALVGKAREQLDGIADQIGRRFVAGVEQKDAVLREFDCAERLALALDQPRQHMVLRIARSCAAPGDQPGKISVEPYQRV